MKKYVLAGLATIALALPATGALAAADNLTGAIQQGQQNTVSADVKNQLATAEDEDAGQVDQNGEQGQVGETENKGDGSDAQSGEADGPTTNANTNQTGG